MKWETFNRGFSNWHSTQSLIFGYDPNLSSWKHCRTTVNNSLHKPSTISQAKNSVKQHRMQNCFYAHILTTCAKQHNIQNYFYADILTTCTTPKFSLAFVNTTPWKWNLLKNSEIKNWTITFTQLQYTAKLKTKKITLHTFNLVKYTSL